MADRQSSSLTDDLSHVEFETSEDVEVLSTFDTMNLREDLVRGIYSYGELRTFIAIPEIDGWLTITLPMVRAILVRNASTPS